MELTRYEQETIFNYNEGEGTASIYTHNKALRRKLEKLSGERPEECQLVKISFDGRAADYAVPKSWIRITPPRQLSPEQKAHRAAIARRTFLAEK